MSKFIVELWLDGYETNEEMEGACLEFIEDQLNITASSVKVEKFDSNIEERVKLLENILKQIIDDLPSKRDWLDPSLEAEAIIMLRQNKKVYDEYGVLSRDCKKGGKCEWRTDGQHSNIFCGKCFKSI